MYRVLTTVENCKFQGICLILGKLGKLIINSGKMMLSQMVTVLQYSMCCLSTFLKATLLFYDIKPISWTSS